MSIARPITIAAQLARRRREACCGRPTMRTQTAVVATERWRPHDARVDVAGRLCHRGLQRRRIERRLDILLISGR